MFNTLLVDPILNLLALLYALVHDFGLAVILLTIVIRGLLWPMVTKQLHNQRALQELQPELQRIKSEAKGDKQLEGQMVMELYKEREINPFASFLPLLIQLPIFFALFIVLRDIVKPGEIAATVYEPLKQLPVLADIISGKTTFQPTLLGLIDLTKASVFLAVLSGIAQFIQTKQITPKHQADDSQAQIMKGMMYVFPGLTFFIGLSLPSALPLYWATASGIAILQQYLVLKRDVRELEDGTPMPKSSAKSAPRFSPKRSTSAPAPNTTPTRALPAKSGKPKKKGKGGK